MGFFEVLFYILVFFVYCLIAYICVCPICPVFLKIIGACIAASPIPEFCYRFTPDEFRNFPSDVYDPEYHEPYYMLYSNYSVNLYLFSKFWNRMKQKLSRKLPSLNFRCTIRSRSSSSSSRNKLPTSSYELAPTTTVSDTPSSLSYIEQQQQHSIICVNDDDEFLSHNEMLMRDDNENLNEASVPLLQQQ
ncbi:hypothetical protein BDC45DRAFT_558554 [Circinella umbellata]|nr:hypothetical protein BDC45DRAFT_558554 [Circinella umbellata]